jgi:hypothetical protein
VYLDDVIVKGRTFEEHLLNLRKVFQRFREAFLKLNPEKSQLLQKEVRYLGHIVSSEGTSTDPERLNVVRERPTPKNKHEIRSFLGLCTYYRRFIPGFANLAKPVTKPTEQKQTFQWTSEVEAAFKTPKGALCTAPILAYPQPGERFVVETDASSVGIGGVLSQVQDGQERVIAYCSKTLNKAERNYCVTRRKLFAIVRPMEHFHKYLYGQEFHLRTDHSALTWLMSFKNLEGHTARWIQRLQEYNFISEHCQGRKHNNADALSRRPCQEECTHYLIVEARADIKHIRAIAAVAAPGWDPATLRTEQLNDPDIGPILQEVGTGHRPEWKDIADRSPTYKSYWARWKSLVVRNDILERNWESANGRSTIAQNSHPSEQSKGRAGRTT